MRILITGGAGFIGHNLARVALAQGHEVVVIDDLSNGTIDNISSMDVEFHQASILDEEKLAEAMAGVEAVVHLGALGSVPRSIATPFLSHAANATGTLAVLEQARRSGIQHVITSSSSSVYGMNPALPKDERQWVRPMSPYAVTKLAAEQYTLAYQQSYGLQTLAFRFFNVYGPGQRAGHVYSAVIPTFIDAILAGRPVPVHGDGTQSRDFTYVGTVCRVVLDAVENRVWHPEPVNLAFGTNTNLLTILDTLREIVSLPVETEHLPKRSGDVSHSQAQNTSLRELFPNVRPTPLLEGLKETVTWFQSKV